MELERERKFLVEGDFRTGATSSRRLVQAYLSSHPERSVRIRIAGSEAFLTIKGSGNTSGISRIEWERSIPLEEGEGLLNLCEPGRIEKIRHQVPVGDHVFEVDVFGGENEGLILAEIELSREDEPFERPSWLGEEVTGKPQYYNVSLIQVPFSQWSNDPGGHNPAP